MSASYTKSLKAELQSGRSRFLVFGSAAWFLGLIGYFTFYPDLAERLFIAILAVRFGAFLCGVGFIICGLASFQQFKRSSVWSITVGIIGITLFLTIGAGIGQHIRFRLVRSHYETRLKEVLNAPQRATRRKDCEVDDGPPMRVAFYWHRGVVDNWVGLVYDPTGEVLRANKFKRDWSNWQDPQLRPVKQLFGGDIFRAKRLAKNWYLCWFT